MKNFKTPSEKYRQQGNEIFAKLKQQEDAAFVVRQGRFTDALKYYNQALNASMNDDERASAHKNLGSLYSYQITSTNIESANKNDYNHNLKECITSYGYALQLGKNYLTYPL
ncbi:unnamed protein product [Rotaria socialis]|uniref:Tetratricopeptide repeat protein n=1 Tax=Rotaria socialis TaxID=392032 RepID=A0A821IJ70_9BILA|nr:unnamed protein product [Rotaria socialis]